jgi:hypothetical protein
MTMKRVVKVRHSVWRTMVAVSWVSGFTKFEVTPVGGGMAGVSSVLIEGSIAQEEEAGSNKAGD